MLQIIRFKDHSCVFSQRQRLTGDECQFLVIIKHRIQVLNPLDFNIAIENDPLEFVMPLLHGCSHRRRDYAFLEVFRLQIGLAI